MNEEKIIYIKVDTQEALIKIDTLAKSLDSLDNKNSQIAKQTKAQMSVLAKALADEEKLRQQKIKTLIQEEKLELQKMKTTQQSTKQVKVKEGYINELRDTVKQLEQAYFALNKAELDSAKGAETLKALKDKRIELSKLQQAYGNHTLNVGNYSSATKMLGINLGQVMKEMPNFAISARIGIMSLTNNLPMLAETIKQVRVEQLAAKKAQEGMTAAQIAALGPGAKMPSMFKLISQSVFGLTGIMSIAMVLLQLYGGQIVEWIGSLFKGKDALEEVTIANKAFNEVMKDGSDSIKSAKSDVLDVESAFRQYKAGTISATEALKIYNEKLGDNLGKHTDINAAMNTFNELAPKYVEWSLKMAVAENIKEKAAEATVKRMKAEEEQQDKNVKGIHKLVAALVVWDSQKNREQAALELTQELREKNVVEAQKEEDAYSKTYKALIDEAEEFAKAWGIITTNIDDDNKTMTLATFDYQSKIMEAQANAMERSRERDLKSVDADYTKKLNLSVNHIKKLEQQETKGVKGATAALAEARKQHAEYEIALTEEKNRKIFEIDSKYTQMRINLTLDRLQKQFAIVEAEGGRSAKQIYDDTIANIDAEKVLRAAAIESDITDLEQKNQQLALLNEDYMLKRAVAEESFRKSSLKEEETVLSNKVDATKAAFNEEMTAEQKAYEDSKALLKLKMDEEIRQAGDNEALILSIRQKYAQATIDLDEKVRVERAAKFAFWADKSKQLVSDVGAFMQAKDNFELQSYAKTIKGKANYDQLYAKKKMELEIKQAKREKAIGIFNATIDTASAIMDIWAKNAGNPILAGILTALAAATGIAQIATIASTPLPSADSSSGSGSVDVPTTTVTEKFHTGTYRPSTRDEEKEITRTLLTTERVLSPQQTTLFDNIIGRMQSYGGSGQIMQGVGVSAVLEEKMIERAFTKAIERMPNPVMTWSEFENQAARQSRLRNNAIIR